jgi:Protein of unknown function (DUF1572)
VAEPGRFAEHYLEDALRQLRKLKAQAERAVAQIPESDWFTALDPEANSIAIVMKHVAGNMRSRWTDFLTSDGEKPDRRRDSEFEREGTDTAQSIRERWENGWRLVFAAIEPLQPEDLLRTVTVRGEAHTVTEAINRQMTHYAGHVGQIVLLAKHFAGPAWKSLSIARGKSRDVDVGKEGESYRLGAGHPPRA